MTSRSRLRDVSIADSGTPSWKKPLKVSFCPASANLGGTKGSVPGPPAAPRRTKVEAASADAPAPAEGAKIGGGPGSPAFSNGSRSPLSDAAKRKPAVALRGDDAPARPSRIMPGTWVGGDAGEAGGTRELRARANDGRPRAGRPARGQKQRDARPEETRSDELTLASMAADVGSADARGGVSR
jgi:hypothetical protein